MLNERLSLEQLKAMSDEQLMNQWRGSNGNQFPFDFADCGNCLTLHAFGEARCHPHIQQEILALDPDVMAWCIPNLVQSIRKHLEELYALRLFYDHLYPQPVEQEKEAEQVSARMEESEWDSRANTR